MDDMNEKNKNSANGKLDQITTQEDKILHLLKEERRRVKEKFPLTFALTATIGAAATLSGINKLIDQVDFLVENPLVLVIIGLTILLATGAAYRKLG